MAQSGWNDVAGLAEFVANPIERLTGLGQLINNPEARKQFGDSVVNELNVKIETIKTALEVGGDENAEALGTAIGEIAWQVGSIATGVGGAAKGGVALVKAGIKVGAQQLEKMAEIAKIEKLAAKNAKNPNPMSAMTDSETTTLVDRHVLDGGAKGGAAATVITPEMEAKILFGERVTNANGTPTNRLIGAHAGEISNLNPNYAVEVLSVNIDGTRNKKLVTQFTDGNLSTIKSSTLFPENWTSSQTMGAVKQVGDMPPVATRADGATLYQSTVDGVKIEVIKVGNNVTAAYPCGRGCTSPTTFAGQ